MSRPCKSNNYGSGQTKVTATRLCDKNMRKSHFKRKGKHDGVLKFHKTNQFGHCKYHVVKSLAKASYWPHTSEVSGSNPGPYVGSW